MHSKTEMRIIYVLMVLYATACNDVGYRIATDSEQQRTKKRSFRNDDVGPMTAD